MNNININCPKCGASLNGDSLYCNYCGTAITDVRDLLKKKAEMELHKQENEEQLRLEKEKHQMLQGQMLLKIIFLVIGLGTVLFMCIMASR